MTKAWKGPHTINNDGTWAKIKLKLVSLAGLEPKTSRSKTSILPSKRGGSIKLAFARDRVRFVSVCETPGHYCGRRLLNGLESQPLGFSSKVIVKCVTTRPSAPITYLYSAKSSYIYSPTLIIHTAAGCPGKVANSAMILTDLHSSNQDPTA